MLINMTKVKGVDVDIDDLLLAEHTMGYNEGHAAGTIQGHALGYAEGNTAGYTTGHAAGTIAGHAAGYTEGTADGYAEGYAVGYAQGVADTLPAPPPPEPPANLWSVKSSMDFAPVGGQCGSIWPGADTYVSADRGHNGTPQSCKMSIGQGQEAWGGGVAFTAEQKSVKGDELWCRWATYFPAGFNFDVQPAGGSRLKFFRLSHDLPGGGIDGRFDMQIRDDGSGVSLGLEKEWSWVELANTAIAYDVWQVWEVYFKFDDVGTTAKTRVWLDGVLKWDNADKPNMIQAGNYVPDVRFFDHWNEGSPVAQHMYFDGLIITNGVPGSTDANGNPFIGT